jgi:adenylate cyclase
MPATIGALLNGRYRLEVELGRGGMGRIYRAHDTLLDRHVAVKVLSASELGTQGRARLLREAQAAAGLNHPNVVSVYDAGEAEVPGSVGAVPFIVMELVEGASLHDCPPASLDEILSIACQVCNALDHAHAHGVIHRDLKPENVLLLPDGSAKLVDFGLAHTVASRLTAEGATLGTVFYIAPEQALGQEIDGRADLYTLGVMLYEWMAGRLPFEGDDPLALIGQHLHAPVVPPCEHNPEIPPALDALIVQLMSKRPEDRPASAAEVRQALETLVHVPAAEEVPLDRTRQPGFLTDAEERTAERPPFVARERELAWLKDRLDAALAGQGCVVFVTGGAGRGKTALLDALARQAMDEHPELLVASGTCNAYSGVGDPYLPFREVLAMLCGDVEAHWAAGAISRDHALRLWQALPASVESLLAHGPHVMPALVPGEALLARASAACPNAPWLRRLREGVECGLTGADGLQQSHLFQQVSNVLCALSQVHPLLLVLDDLQWVDRTSAGLLFHLGRRLEGSRILIVGAYRPEEVTASLAARGREERERHPLEKVLAEFRRLYGDVWLDLAEVEAPEGRRFVDAYLETEPNRLGERFRQTLTERAQGHPLFTVELLRAMQERGDLVQDQAGSWVEGPALDWDLLPARVEGVIGERIEGLGEELRQILTVASVEGEDFTAEVVAQVQSQGARELIQRLSRELQHQHRLVRAQGLRHLDARRLALYRFQHHLFQKYLYNSLDEAERAYLHEDVGTVLEALYGDQTDEVAVQLARHFLEAGVTDKAAQYLGRAGTLAAEQYANEEALAHLSRALELTPETDLQERYEILLTRERIFHVRGNRREQGEDLAVLAQLGEALDTALQNESRNRVIVLLRQARFHRVIGDYSAAIAAAQDAISLAQSSHNVEHEAEGYLALGRALLYKAEHTEAQSALGNAVATARSCRSRQLVAHALRGLGGVAFRLYDLAAARDYWEQALKTYRDIGDQHSEGATLNNLGLVAWWTRDFSDAKSFYKQALDLVRKTGYREGEGSILNNLGLVLSDECDYPGAEPVLEQALTIVHQIGDRHVAADTIRNLGHLHLYRGSYSKARDFAEKALRVCREIGDRRKECWLLYDLGMIAAYCGDLSKANIQFEHTLRSFREVGDTLGEGMALLQLGDVLGKCGVHAEALTCTERASCILSEVGGREYAGWVLTHRGLVAARLGDYATARTSHEAAQDIYREIDDPRSQSWGWANLGLLAHQSGDNEGAQEYSQRALEIAENLGIRDEKGYALTNLGHARVGLGDLGGATDVYQNALGLRREIDQPHLTTEPLAGLARVAMIQGDFAQARAYVEEILAHLESGSLDGTDEPFRVYLTCYRVLHANQDPRAEEILMTAHSLLQERAAKIEDEGLRCSFRENVVAHRQIVAAWEKVQASRHRE